MKLKNEYDYLIASTCNDCQMKGIENMVDKFRKNCGIYTSSDHASQSKIKEVVQENRHKIDWGKYRQLKRMVSIPNEYLKFFQENERAANLALLYLTFNTQGFQIDSKSFTLDFRTRSTIDHLLNKNFTIDDLYKSKTIKFFNSGLSYKIDMIQIFLSSITRRQDIKIKILRLFSLQFQKHQKKRHFQWLKKSNKQQCKWAVDYLRKKQSIILLPYNLAPLLSEDLNIFNDYDFFTLFIDVSRLNHDEKDKFLKRAERSWNEYKSYNKKKKLSKNCKIRTNDLRSDKDIVIERKIIEKIHKKAREMKIHPRELIEKWTGDF